MNTFRPLAADLYSGGQPTPAELAELGRQGLRTVINLRPASEASGFDEAATVAGLGLRYVPIPVAGSADLSLATVRRFAAALAAARSAGPVLVHCASGNRVGALLALAQGWLHGATPAAALALGRSAGLASLEGAVAALLADGAPG